VSVVSGIPIPAFRTRSRKREIVEARHAYCILALEFKPFASYTLDDIAKVINRNHATVLHAKKNESIPEIQKIYNRAKILL